MKRTILFKQLTAVTLLFVLLLVNTIQILHTHPENKLLASQKKAAGKKGAATGLYTNTADSKCFICEYQLAKDADHTYASFHFTAPLHYSIATAITYCFIPSGNYNFFETRGPPSLS